MRFRLDDELVKRAGLTDKQRQALEFYDGVNYGYRFVARQMDIDVSTARGHVRAGLRKVEKVTRA